MQLRDRTVLITGGTSGIGLELATRLAERGNAVIVTGRNQAGLDAAARRSLITVCCDVAQPDAIADLYATVAARFPTLDVLVNNAGVMRNLRLADAAGVADITREVDVLLSGPIRMVQQFLPLLLRQREAAVINVSSGLAFVPMPIAPVYCAAKAGLHSYTQSLRVQLAGTHVAVIEVAPPPVETPLLRHEFADELQGQKAMTPAALVARSIKAIEAGKTEITPGAATILKYAGRWAPGFMLRRLGKVGSPHAARG